MIVSGLGIFNPNAKSSAELDLMVISMFGYLCEVTEQRFPDGHEYDSQDSMILRSGKGV